MHSWIRKIDIEPILNSIINYAVFDLSKTRIMELDLDISVQQAIYLQNLTNEAKYYITQESILELRYLQNLNSILNQTRIEGTALLPKEINQIASLLHNCKYLKQKFGKNINNYSNLNDLCYRLFYDSILEKEILKVVDENNEIKDSASRELKIIREQIKSKKENLQKVAEKILNRLSKDNITQEDYFTIREDRIVLPIKSEYKRIVKGFIHSESASGQTTYIEPEETLELNNEILSLIFSEKREIDRILKLLTSQIALYSEQLSESFSILIDLDIIFAKARYSVELNASKINFSDRIFHIIDCQHPYLIRKLGVEKTVPFSIIIPNEIKCIVISGPNAGGKTVFMKTIGLLIIFSKLGLHFPFHPDSQIPFFDDIYLDIGDDQSIESDISTYGSHIKRIKYIYEKVNSRSMVLLDELGTGTDPVDGVSLATGILKSFLEKKCFIITTTHHSQLKIFAANHPNIINCSLEFDSKSLKPTYKFIQGIPGSSYAFEIAERQKLDKKIINFALELKENNNSNVESFLIDLQKQILENEKLNRKLKEDKNNFNNLRKDLENRLFDVMTREKELKKQKVKDAIEYMQTAKSLIEKTIKEIKETNADRDTIKSRKKDLSDFEKKIQGELDENHEMDYSDFKIGDNVIIEDRNTHGIIIDIDKKRNIALIQSGNIKIRGKFNDLIKDNSPVNHIKEKSNHRNFTNNLPVRLNIMGKRINELEVDLIKYLDEMSVSGINTCEILHGKGEGILKKYVNDILKQHPFVEKFYSAPIELGGDGITIIKFKD